MTGRGLCGFHHRGRNIPSVPNAVSPSWSEGGETGNFKKHLAAGRLPVPGPKHETRMHNHPGKSPLDFSLNNRLSFPFGHDIGAKNGAGQSRLLGGGMIDASQTKRIDTGDMHQPGTYGTGGSCGVSRPFHIDQSMLLFLRPADVYMPGGMNDDIHAFGRLAHIAGIDNVSSSPFYFETSKRAQVFRGTRKDAHLLANFQEAANNVISQQPGSPGNEIFHCCNFS